MPGVTDLVERYGKQRYLTLSLIAYLLADSLFTSRLLTWGMLTVMIVTGPLAVSERPRHTRLTIALAIAMVGLGYCSSFMDVVWLQALALVVSSAFFLALIWLLSGALFAQKRVTGETLWGAVSVYLLLGMLFAFLYALVELVSPGAYSGNLLGRNPDTVQTFVYYSFVTMTTLGYGDITPQIPVAASLAYVQALVGQLYVAVLVARLVSMYGAERKV
jgi:voltage-gated potassium channel